MSKPPKHSRAAEKAHPAPKRERFKTAKAYAEACRLVSEARIEFDKAAKSAKAKVSAKSKQSTVARPGGSKNKQKPETAAKPLTTAQKLDAIGIDAVCEKVADCMTLQVIANEAGVSKGSLIAWLANYSDQYTRAREAQADKMAEDILAIADEGGLEPVMVDDVPLMLNGKPVMTVSNAAVQQAKLRVDARKWLAGKMAPKKYGDRLNLDADVRVADLTDEQVNVKLAELAAKARSRQDCNGTDA